jgi:hypothetical protein
MLDKNISGIVKMMDSSIFRRQINAIKKTLDNFRVVDNPRSSAFNYAISYTSDGSSS